MSCINIQSTLTSHTARVHVVLTKKGEYLDIDTNSPYISHLNYCLNKGVNILNRTEWSPIRCVIIQVIKENGRPGIRSEANCLSQVSN